MLIEKLLCDPPIELVQVHRLDACLDLLVPGLQFLDRLRVGRLVGLVGGQHIATEPFEDGLRNDQLLQDLGELACENLLARVGLLAFSAVTSAVVVHVLPLLQLADKQAAAMAAVDQSGVREVVLHLPGPVLGTSIQQLLNTLPTFAGDQRLVGPCVRPAIPIEIAGVQPFPQNLVNDTAVVLATAQPETFDCRRGIRIRDNHTLAAGPVGVPITWTTETATLRDARFASNGRWPANFRVASYAEIATVIRKTLSSFEERIKGTLHAALNPVVFRSRERSRLQGPHLLKKYFSDHFKGHAPT